VQIYKIMFYFDNGKLSGCRNDFMQC